MAQFFISRPVFAWVVSILIMVLGSLAITQLPVAQYPSVAPPSISVTANYAGASAETLKETVTSVIEQQLNGIDNLLYMSSSSDASGVAIITLYFLPGIFLIPVFYVVVRRVFQRMVKNAPNHEAGTSISGGGREPIV